MKMDVALQIQKCVIIADSFRGHMSSDGWLSTGHFFGNLHLKWFKNLFVMKHISFDVWIEFK